MLMITTSTLWRLAIHFGYRISPTDGASSSKHTEKYADLSNMSHDIVSIIPHGVGVEASFYLGQDVIRRRHSKTTGERLREKVVVSQFARATNRILAGDCPALGTAETENNLELKTEVDERKSHRMAKVYDFLEMWQGSQNECATQKESHAQNKQITAIGYISNTEEIIQASWLNFQHDGGAAFKLSERFPLPPAFAAKDLPGGRMHLLNLRQIRRINCHSGDSNKDSEPKCVSDSKNWLNKNRNVDNPIESEDECVADNESDIEPWSGITSLESPWHHVLSAAPNVPGLIRLIRKSMKLAETGLVPVSTIETRRNNGKKQK